MSHNGLLISIELDKELLVDEKQLFVRLRLLKKYDLCSLANESSSFRRFFSSHLILKQLYLLSMG